MSWIWVVLGLLLLAVVGGVLYLFFVARPRNAAQVTASVKVLSRETHGRAPEVIVPASCVTTNVAGRADLPGLGVLALSDQGLFFAAADPDRTLVIPRAAVTEAGVSKTAAGHDGPVASALPMLVVRWRNAAGESYEAGFTTADPAGLSNRLQPGAHQ